MKALFNGYGCIVCVIIAGLTALPVKATNRYVSLAGSCTPPYTNWATAATNIQYVVDYSSASDVIWVTNDTYYVTNQVSIAKGVTLISTGGLAVINGNSPPQSNRCLNITHTNAVIDGFVVTKGRAQEGGGIYINGGIIRNCTVTDNVATGAFGGGGGIKMISKGNVVDCLITSNSTSSANGPGGGIYMTGGTINRCTITGNNALQAGGGVYASGTAAMSNCIVQGNTSATEGGGINMAAGTTIKNSLINVNSAVQWGGGVFCNAGGDIWNCTITSNSALNVGGVRCNNGHVWNTIIHFNYSSGIISNWNTAGTTMFFTNCCTTPTNNIPGAGNIADNPRFLNLAGGNYRLAPDSACINKGTNQEWMTSITDMDGRPRINSRYGGIVDMGAYEFIPQGTVFFLR